MDEYSKSGPKSAQSERKQRERETYAQMRDLLAIQDENALATMLAEKYDARPGEPRYDAIMKIWRDAQQRLQRER